MANAEVALDALGDPTRRRILDLLRGDERSVRELTDALDVSQSAVSQHLRALREAGLVAARPVGLGGSTASIETASARCGPGSTPSGTTYSPPSPPTPALR